MPLDPGGGAFWGPFSNISVLSHTRRLQLDEVRGFRSDIPDTHPIRVMLKQQRAAASPEAAARFKFNANDVRCARTGWCSCLSMTVPTAAR